MYTTLTIPLTSNKQSSNPYIQDSLDKSSTNLLLHSQSWQVTHFEVIKSDLYYHKRNARINTGLRFY